MKAPLQPPRPLTPDAARALLREELKRSRETRYGYDPALRPPEADVALRCLCALNETPADPRDERVRIDAGVAAAAALHAWLDAKAAGDTQAATGGTGWRMPMGGVT